MSDGCSLFREKKYERNLRIVLRPREVKKYVRLVLSQFEIG